MDIHELKTDSEPYVAIFEGRKRADFRKLDRDFKVGDAMVLKHFLNGELTGERIITSITHIQTGYGIPDGYGMISFNRER